MSDSLVAAQRYVIAAVVVLTAVLFAPALADPVNVVKLTVLVLGALLLLPLSAVRVLRHRIAVLPVGPASIAAAVLLVGFLTAALAAPTAASAVVGAYGRNSGLLAYAAAIVLFFVGVRVWTSASAHVLALAFVLAGLFSASYGLFQYAGIDAIRWNNPFNPIIAALGNPDFASGYLGICAPLAAWGALWTRWSRPWRIASAIAAATCLVAALLSSAVQGPLAAATGLSVLAVAWALDRDVRTRKRVLLGLGGAAALGLLVLVAGIAKLGPAKSFFSGYSYDARTWYWGAAIDLFQRKPLFGAGLDQYGTYWRQLRPADSTRVQGGDAFSDSAHSVPLQMLAEGGLVLAIAYLAFLVLVAWVLVRGLLRLEGQNRLLLGGLGGAWAAYVVQSLVSIDQVPLLTAEFVLAGAIVGMARPQLRILRLPGALQTTASDRRGRRGRGPVIRERTLTATDVAAITVVSLVCLVAAWFALVPMRASAAVHSGDVALNDGDGNEALAHYQRANRLMPGVGNYWGKTGSLYDTVKHPELALATFRRGIRHDPYDIFLLINAGRLAADQNAVDEAATYLRRAAELDPSNPATVQPYAEFALKHDRSAEAMPAIERLLGIYVDDPNLLVTMGRLRLATGDSAGARAAYESALAARPDFEAAKTALAALDQAK